MARNVSGNTFSNGTWSTKKGERVWREIRHRYPAGGTIVNAEAFAESGIIPSGCPCVFDDSKYEITAVNASAYDAGKTYKVGESVLQGGKLYICKTEITTPEAFASSKWTQVTKIDGYLQEDAWLEDGTYAATGTVIYSGELYAYMFDSAVLAVLKGISPAEIHFVN